MDSFDYSAGVASTEASGVAPGLTVAFGVGAGVTFPFGVALVDAVELTDGDGDGVLCTSS